MKSDYEKLASRLEIVERQVLNLVMLHKSLEAIISKQKAAAKSAEKEEPEQKEEVTPKRGRKK